MQLVALRLYRRHRKVSAVSAWIWYVRSCVRAGWGAVQQGLRQKRPLLQERRGLCPFTMACSQQRSAPHSELACVDPQTDYPGATHHSPRLAPAMSHPGCAVTEVSPRGVAAASDGLYQNLQVLVVSRQLLRVPGIIASGRLLAGCRTSFKVTGVLSDF